MIKGAYTIKVGFSPVSNIEIDGVDFSQKILKTVKGSRISSGSAYDYPSVTGYAYNHDEAKQIEETFCEIIEEYGGTVKDKK